MKKNLLLTFTLLFALVGLNAVLAQSITGGTAFSGITTTYGSISVYASSTLQATGLPANATITATAPTGLTVSINGGPYGTTATINADGAGDLLSTPIYIRFDGTSAAAPGAYNGLSVTLANGATTSSINIGNSTVNTKALTVSGVTATSREYDRTTAVTVNSVGATLSGGLVGSDVVTLAGTGSGVFADALVANAKPVTVTGFTLSGAQASRYTLTQPSPTANITAKPLTLAIDPAAVTGITAVSKIYDGTTTASLNGPTNLVGVVLGDAVSPDLSGASETFATKTVGVAKAVTVSGITLTGLSAGNYSITQPTGLTADITAKPLTINSLSVSSKFYDKTTTATLVGGVLVGTVLGDFVAIDPASYTANFTPNADAGTGKLVVVSGLAVTGTDAGNYTVTQPVGLTGDILPALITFSGTTIASRAYNATTTPGAVTIGTIHGLMAGETLGYSATAPNYFATYPGTYVFNLHYTLSDATLPAIGKASNYVVYDEFTSGIVTPVPLSITAPTIASKVFDGTNTTGTVTVGTITGFVGAETVTATGIGTFSTPDVGVGKAATITYVLGPGSGGGLPNYYTLAPGSGTGDVTPKPINVHVKANNKHHDGNTTATVGTATLPDVTAADAPNVTINAAGVTASFADANLGHAKPVTVSGYTFGGSKAGNSIISQPTGCTADITSAEGEIGDFVWQDYDGNGIQDPGELGYPGITVELHAGLAPAANAVPLATAVTDVNGKYSFSHDASGVSTTNFIYGIAGLTPGQPYTIRIPNVAGANKQGWLGTNVLTVPNAGADDTKDSDGDFPVGVTDYAEFGFTCPPLGTDKYDIDFGFTAGAIPGGGGGGLESKSLGDAIGIRVFNKAVASVSKKVDYSKLPLVQSRTIQNGTMGIGTALTLQELLPQQITGANFKAYNSTPKDITAITNAKDVLSIDYTLNNSAKAVAFATKTQNEVYDHTKAICDRLKGSELLAIQNLSVENVKLVRYDLKNTEGQTEYALSFAVGAKTGRANYTIQSNWLNNDYTPDEVMFNVQLWSASSEVLVSMAKDIITRLNASMPVSEVLSTNDIPKTYITKGKRVADKITLNIQNATSNTNGYFEILEKANEQSTLLVKRQVPFTVDANGKTNIDVPEGDNYESTINMYINNKLQDQVFMSDGNWAAAVNNSNSTIKSVNAINDPKRVTDNADDFLLYRNVKVEATTPDYVSVYKVLRGGGAPQDLTGYRTFQFTASGTGANTSLVVTIIKDGITNWADQYSVILPMSSSPKEYKVNLDEFISTASKNKISPSDVSMVIFGIGVNSGNMTTVTADISNVSFTKTDFVYLNSLKSTEISVYPNPARNNFTANFKSANQAVLTMNLTDAATGKVIFSKTVNAQVGNNSVPVSLSTSTGLSSYILSLEGAGIKYTPKKVLMEK